MRWSRVLVVIVGVLVALNVIALVADALTPSPSGPPSSSFATSPRGLAAWSTLTQRHGVAVGALRSAPSDATLPAAGTVVMLDPGTVLHDEAVALRRFAERGGTVIAGARDPGDWLDVIAGRQLHWQEGGPRSFSEPAGTIRTAGEGSWGTNVLERAPAGRGAVVLVADPSFLQNRLLDQADNAAVALSLAGAGPVAFVESVHGYGTGRGLGALPERVQWALWLALAAVLVLMWARGRRLGPAEPAGRELPPPRVAYVDALAATLRKGDR
jgi:uncharacterized protein DUF4350